VETSTEEPLVREVELSTKRVVSEPGVPLKLAAGQKRIVVFEARKRAVESERELEMDVQLIPSVDHCQLPCAANAVFVIMAIPARVLALDPPVTVSVVSERLAEKSELTDAPDGLLSSLAAARDAEPEATGASLTAETEMLKVEVSFAPEPSVMV
jgi:hypothetical protein